MITNRNLTPGSKLVATYKGETHTATVTEVLNIKLEDGRVFKTLSAAGTGITGKSCNGWSFWTVEGQERITTLAIGSSRMTLAEAQREIEKVMWAEPAPRYRPVYA